MAKGTQERDKYWPVIEAFFDQYGLVGQHLDSYNRFIREELQHVVDSVGKLTPKIEGYIVELGDIHVEEPSIREADGSEHKLYPNEARIRNLTYASKLHLDMTPVRKEGSVSTRLETMRIYIGDLPVMLRSEKCHLNGLSDEELIKHGEDPKDPGGYFIINGSERVLVTQEDLAPNRILIEEASKSSSFTHIGKVFSTSRGFRAPVTIERKRTGELRVSFPSVPGKIPLAILLKALGLESDRDIVDVISDDDEIRNELIVTIEQSAPINAPTGEEDESTRSNALDFIGKRVAVGQTKEYRLARAEKVLDRYLLPHIGTEEDSRLQKAYYLGQMVERLLELVLTKRAPDDKDHYANKRLKLSGDLLMSLFRVALYSLTRDIN
jgi:DNA-directed RNA polymerase subunit B